jgi:hypothetical protein
MPVQARKKKVMKDVPERADAVAHEAVRKRWRRVEVLRAAILKQAGSSGYDPEIFLSEHTHLIDELIKGMQANLDSCLKERIKRFRIFCEKLAGSRKILLSGAKDKNSALISLHDRAIEKSQTALDIFAEESNNENPGKNGEIFIRIIKKQPDLHTKEYISFIQGLKRKYKDMGIKCLYEIEKNISEKLLI